MTDGKDVRRVLLWDAVPLHEHPVLIGDVVGVREDPAPFDDKACAAAYSRLLNRSPGYYYSCSYSTTRVY